MRYTVKFDDLVVKVIAKWKKSNPVLFKKFTKIVEAIALDPRHGIGHPEPLVGGGDITYSRRITASDRVIYTIHDEEIYVLIIDLGGHYNDKCTIFALSSKTTLSSRTKGKYYEYSYHDAPPDLLSPQRGTTGQASRRGQAS